MRIAIVGTFHFCGESIFFLSLYWNDFLIVLPYKITAQQFPMAVDSLAKENAFFSLSVQG